MAAAQINQNSPCCAVVSGTLDASSAMALKNQGEALIAQLDSPINIDLGAIDSSNTAGVAVLLAWVRTAKRLDKSLAFIGIPEKMLAIARLSDVDDILSVVAEH